MTNLISVGIPFYNAQNYLAFAIQSVIAQSYENWELILVDDGSSDNSLRIAQEFAHKDGRIKVITDGENKKLPYRLNQLIKESKGEFIARMDADDIMHPDRLKKQIEFLLQYEDIDLVSGSIVSIDNNNNVMGLRGVNELTLFDNNNPNFPIIHPTVTARKDWFLRNLYSVDYPRAEDFELWCRASSKNDLRIAILSDILLFYREFGNLEINKLINSYRDGQKIRKKYNLNNSFTDYFRVELKCLIVRFLALVGLEQNLAMQRNSSFLSINDKTSYQAIVYNIVNKL